MTDRRRLNRLVAALNQTQSAWIPWLLLIAIGAIVRIALWHADPHPLIYGDSGTYIQSAFDPNPYALQPKGVSLFWRMLGLSIPHIMIAGFVLTLLIAWSAWMLSRGRFWVPVVLVLNPLTMAYERVMLSEHLFAALCIAGVLLLMRRSPLAGAMFGLAAITRTVGVVLLIPLTLFLLVKWPRLLIALSLFAGIVAWYVAAYVYPSTHATSLAFLGPNALTVVAPIVDCPPAPPDVCPWREVYPNGIFFRSDGPVQTRIRALGWKQADAELRQIVYTAMRRHPIAYATGYVKRIPHLFNLAFGFDQGGPGTVYAPSAAQLYRLHDSSPGPGVTSTATRWWGHAVRLGTIAGGVVVIWGFFSIPRREVMLSCLLMLLASIAFNDATGRFLYPVIPMLLPYLRVPPVASFAARHLRRSAY